MNPYLKPGAKRYRGSARPAPQNHKEGGAWHAVLAPSMSINQVSLGLKRVTHFIILALLLLLIL